MRCAPSATSHSSSSPAAPFATRLPPCRSALQRAAAQRAVHAEAHRRIRCAARLVRAHPRTRVPHAWGPAWGSPCVRGAAKEARAAPVSQRCGAAPLGWAVHAGAAEGPAHRPTCVVGAVGEAVVRRLRDHVRKVQPLNGAVQWCSAEQCSAVQRSAAQCSAAQWGAALCRAVPRPTHSVQCRACRHHCGSQSNPSHAISTRSPAIGTAPFESFRKFPKVLPRCGRESAE